MPTIPMEMLIFALAGWLNEEQRVKIEFLEKQIRVLQELHGGRRPRLNGVVCHLSAEPQMLASQRDRCVAIRPT